MPHWLHGSAAGLPVEGELPGFEGATGWLNSPPLTRSDLRGRVVLVNFWTYTCVNWLRQLPYVRAWAGKYASKGLVVVGVHTPEFGFEHDPGNVRREAAGDTVGYPVALDNDYAVWRAFDNHYWPAIYLADGEGRIRYHHFGEGEYARTEMAVQRLLDDPDRTVVSVEPRPVEVAADWSTLRSPENYTGYERSERFASPDGFFPGKPHRYDAPDRLALNEWALAGDWTMRGEAAALHKPNGVIANRFHARDLHLVMGPLTPGTPVRFRVLIDGKPPGEAHGLDVDEQGYGTVVEQRLYQLIRQPTPIVDRLFEIEFLGSGVEAFAFTFG